MLFQGEEAAPVEFARAERRQARVGARREDRQAPRREVRDVTAVDIGHVERRLELVGRFKELLRRVHTV